MAADTWAVDVDQGTTAAFIVPEVATRRGACLLVVVEEAEVATEAEGETEEADGRKAARTIAKQP